MMAEYIEREAAAKLIKSVYIEELLAEWWEAEFDNVYVISKKELLEIPAADVRPVIYCEECKHRPAKEYGRIKAPKDADGYTDYKCPFVCEDSWYNRMPADDDYCSCGEKREES